MRFGDYEVLEEIGRGGMGVVYRAHQPAARRDVALKVLSREHATNDDFLARFRREGKAQSRVRHENVLALLDAGEERGTPFLVFELVRGGTLRQRLKEKGALDWREAATLGAEIARGLEAVHEAGFVHRDLKPENVLFDESGRAKLADFGLAGAASASLAVSQALTRTGEVVGTLAFISPEQADGKKDATAKADLYGLGALLYAVLTGSPPFQGTGYALLKQHLLDVPRRPRELAPAIPESFERLVLSLLEKDPERRPESAASVARALDAIARERSRRRAVLPWILLALALAIVTPIGVSSFAAKEAARRRAEARELAARAFARLDKQPSEKTAVTADSEAAAELASRAIDLDPELARAYSFRGWARIQMKDVSGAIADANRALELDPGDFRAWRTRGEARGVRNEWREAIADLGRAIALEPNDARSREERGTALFNMRDYAAALADLTEVVRLDPRSAVGWSRCAELRLNLNDLKGAIDGATRAIDLDPRDADAWRVRAVARQRQHDQAGALADATRASELDPQRFENWTTRAAAHYELHEDPETIADATRGIDLEPNQPYPWLFRGMARKHRGELEPAAADLKRFLELAPSHPSAPDARDALDEMSRMSR